MLELKRRDDARAQTKIVAFIPLSFPSSKNLKFHFVVVQGRQRNVQKSMMYEQLFLLVN